MDKFSSKVHRVHMELGGKLFNSLRIKTQFLERLQSASVVDCATHIQKDDAESNKGSLENVAEIFVHFLCGVQLVLRPYSFSFFSSVFFFSCAANERNVTSNWWHWQTRRGCLDTQIRYMVTKRHNLAWSMVFKAISKTGSL